MSYGAIYIAHNDRDGQNIFKVGKTTRDVHERMKELTAETSNIGEYIAVGYFIVSDVDQAEKTAHERLKQYRIQKNREFFEISLSRLSQKLEEALSNYIVRSELPELENDRNKVDNNKSINADENKLNKNSPSGLLKLKKQQEDEKNNKTEKSKINAINELKNNFEFFKTKAEFFKSDLSEVDNLVWTINRLDDFENFPEKAEYFRVRLFSKFKKEPVELYFSERIGNRSEEEPPDLTNAINPMVNGKALDQYSIFKTTREEKLLRLIKENDPFNLYIEWFEKDDGRLVDIFIKPYVGTRHDGEGVRTHYPSYLVGLKSHKYDGYRECFNNNLGKSCHFDDFEEACEIFIELLSSNLVTPQYDIREKVDWGNTRRSSEIGKIIDRGNVDYSAIEKVYDFE